MADFGESVQDYPPVSEGGPKSAELLPPINESTDFDRLNTTLIGLIERQTGLDLSQKRFLRVNEYLTADKLPRAVDSRELDKFAQREGSIDDTARRTPLAEGPDSWQVLGDINMPDELFSKGRGGRWPHAAGLNFGRNFYGHTVQTMTLWQAEKQKGLKNNGYVDMTRVVGENGVSGGGLTIEYHDKKGNKWRVSIWKDIDDKKTNIKVNKNYKDIDHDKRGLFGPKIPIAEAVREPIGELIDNLPAKGSFKVNEDYYRHSPYQYGLPSSHGGTV